MALCELLAYVTITVNFQDRHGHIIGDNDSDIAAAYTDDSADYGFQECQQVI